MSYLGQRLKMQKPTMCWPCTERAFVALFALQNAHDQLRPLRRLGDCLQTKKDEVATQKSEPASSAR